MSDELRDRLRACLDGRVCLVGLGSPSLGDDGVGIRLAETLRGTAGLEVIVAGTDPERWLDRLTQGGFDHVVFLDAVEVPGAPGAVVLLDAAEVSATFPQISTHRLALGTLARIITAESRTRVWLLGVKPESLRPGARLTAPVTASLDHLVRLITEILGADALRAAGAFEP